MKNALTAPTAIPIASAASTAAPIGHPSCPFSIAIIIADSVMT